MKKLFVILFVALATMSIKAQNFTVVNLKNNSDIRFGKSSKVDRHLSFVVNGPLVNSHGTPVGGYVDNGIQIQSWIAPVVGGGNFAQQNGIFGLKDDGNMILLPYQKWDHTRLKWGFQNGRMLLLDGKNLHNSQSTNRYFRSGIGFKKDNTLVVIVSRIPVTYWELANKFKEEGCTNAIYLDGYTGLNGYVGYATELEKIGMIENATKLQFYHVDLLSDW